MAARARACVGTAICDHERFRLISSLRFSSICQAIESVPSHSERFVVLPLPPRRRRPRGSAMLRSLDETVRFRRCH